MKELRIHIVLQNKFLDIWNFFWILAHDNFNFDINFFMTSELSVNC